VSIVDEQIKQATRLWTVAQPVVSAFVTSVVRDFSARDDVLQEIAVAVIESFARYTPDRPFTAWAMGIAQNQVRLYFRRCHRDRLVCDPELMDVLGAAFQDLPDEVVHSVDRLSDCVGKLDDRSRRLCDLRYTHDMKPAAIADVVGLTANTVAKALQRIREQLRLCLERSAGDEAALEGGLT
jgi:RNA polymerase sigma-70 factor (ECF subfamily)